LINPSSPAAMERQWNSGQVQRLVMCFSPLFQYRNGHFEKYSRFQKPKKLFF